MSKLYLVPTPIGNLKDITYRGVNILNNVDIVLAEDTRKTKKLLSHYDIKTKMYSYHTYNYRKKHMFCHRCTHMLQTYSFYITRIVFYF